MLAAWTDTPRRTRQINAQLDKGDRQPCAASALRRRQPSGDNTVQGWKRAACLAREDAHARQVRGDLGRLHGHAKPVEDAWVALRRRGCGALHALARRQQARPQRAPGP